tara:strand:+ start:1090 stop:2172 length:1083 start_codon:yes stop_codon:yes gene_type:complete
MNKLRVVKRIALGLIVLYLFLASIKLMGYSFKMFGTGFAETLINFTTNPLVGLFIGILATSVVQSSSVITSIVVVLTAAGSLTIGGAIPIIMGANIGTSITTTIVSLAHITKKGEFQKAFEVATIHDLFNVFGVLILFPLELYFHFIERAATYLSQFFIGSSSTFALANPLKIIINPFIALVENVFMHNTYLILIFSLILIFCSLYSFVKIMKPLAESEFKTVLKDHIFNHPIKSFFFGALLTVSVQSSSVTTSLVVPLAGLGILMLDEIFPYILGANVGTAFTSLFASFVIGTQVAITIALCHLLFNLFTIILVLPIRKIPISISQWLAHLSIKNRILPFTFIITMFYLLPSTVIFLFH